MGFETSRGQLSDAGRSQRDEDDLPTSPIEEDPSIQDFLPPTASERHRQGIAASGSTKLCLEVKERVARHVAMKRRDKVVPSGHKGTESSKTGRSKSKDLVQEDSQTPATAPSHASLPHASEAGKQPPRQKAIRRSVAQPKAQKSKSGKKEKQGPVSPTEYAQQLLDKAKLPGKRKSSAVKFLEGKNIFYIGGDMQFAGERTRGRMELVCHRFPIFLTLRLKPSSLLSRL